MNLSNLPEDRLGAIFRGFNRFMMLLWRLGLGAWGNGTEFGGSVMVIKHTGRKSGSQYHTPVNYAEIGEDIYCLAAFGRRADWFRNIQANAEVEVWLPDGRWAGLAEDASEIPEGVQVFRKVLHASGFAGPLFGFDPRKLTDQDLERHLADYRLIRIRRTQALTGPGGPGDLAWIWPLSTMALLALLLGRSKRGGRARA